MKKTTKISIVAIIIVFVCYSYFGGKLLYNLGYDQHEKKMVYAMASHQNHTVGKFTISHTSQAVAILTYDYSPFSYAGMAGEGKPMKSKPKKEQ